MEGNVAWFVIPLLIGLNAFFVSAEYAMVALRPTQLDALRRRSKRVGDAMAQLKSRPGSTIATIQVCITVTNLVLGWMGEPAMSALLTQAMSGASEFLSEDVFRAVSITASFMIVTTLTVVLSELLPKTLTLRFVPVAAMITALPILALDRLLRPAVWCMNGLGNLITRPLGLGRVDDVDAERVSIEELRIITTEAARDGVLTTRERSLILNAMALGQRTAKQIMVPRVKVAYLDLKWDMENNRQVMGSRLYSRLPLCDGGLDNVIGIVHTKEFLTAYLEAGDSSVLQLIARTPTFVPHLTTTDRLLSVFRDQHTQMVLLVDEYGGLSGLVTLRDVVDELVGAVDQSLSLTAAGLKGDITAMPANPLTLRVPGDTPLHELGPQIGITDWCKDENVATLGGVIQSRLGRVPKPGESVEIEGVHLRVLESDRKRIQVVEVFRPGLSTTVPGPVA